MDNHNVTIIDILKEKYEYENERKRYYDNVITLPVSLLAFIVTGIYFITNEKVTARWFIYINSCIIYPLLLSCVVSMFFLFRVFFGHKRKYCSFPETRIVLSDYYKIKDYYNSLSPNADNTTKIDIEFRDFVIKWYLDISDNNIKVNDTRAENFHLSKIFIGISYLLAILVFCLYCYTKTSYSLMATKPTTAPPLPQSPRPTPSPVRREKADKPLTPKK